jgi:pilus assembly protein CpaC
MIREAVALAVFAGCALAQPSRLDLATGKSLVVEAPGGIERVAIGSGEVADAIAVTPTEVLVNGKGPGDTTLLIWKRGGGRIEYDLRVAPARDRIQAVRAALQTEVAGKVTLDTENDLLLLRGTVADAGQASRAAELASALGKVVNLVKVEAARAPAQILLKIRFADVDRGAATELGANFMSTGAANTPGSLTTQQFAPPSVKSVVGKEASFTISDALNLFLFRPDLNLGATIKALQSRNLLQILAEPNLLAFEGKEASFLAGGEFPYPVAQGGGVGMTTVTIQFRQFGIKIAFNATVTPRGAIHLQVAPEVSSLDYTNGLTYQGFAVPGLAVRRVQTEVELENEQSFAIAGLIDNRVAEGFRRIPGLGDIPLFGKLFQSRSVSRNKSELLVVVTPQLVQPIPAGAPMPEIEMPGKWLPGGRTVGPVHPPAGQPQPARAAGPSEGPAARPTSSDQGGRENR